MDDQDNPAKPNNVLDVGSVRHLLTDLNDDLAGKVARLSALASAYDSDVRGDWIVTPGGDVVQEIWREARWSFVHGNYIATVVLCQAFVEHLVAAAIYMEGENLPDRVKFSVVLEHSVNSGRVSEYDGAEITRLMHIRNPLSHFRKPFEAGDAMARVASGRRPLRQLVKDDAEFAIRLGVRLLGKLSLQA